MLFHFFTFFQSFLYIYFFNFFLFKTAFFYVLLRTLLENIDKFCSRKKISKNVSFHYFPSFSWNLSIYTYTSSLKIHIYFIWFVLAAFQHRLFYFGFIPQPVVPILTFLHSLLHNSSIKLVNICLKFFKVYK